MSCVKRKPVFCICENKGALELPVKAYLSRDVRKPDFCICKNKDADQLRSNSEADQRLCFHSQIVQSLYFLNPKFQASMHFLGLHSPVCVGPGRKPRRPVFSEQGSFIIKGL